jgi:hypothetical protein
VTNRIKKFLTMPSVDPHSGSKPDAPSSRCPCGGQLVWFTDQEGEDEPELICVECVRFTIHPDQAECN